MTKEDVLRVLQKYLTPMFEQQAHTNTAVTANPSKLDEIQREFAVVRALHVTLSVDKFFGIPEPDAAMGDAAAAGGKRKTAAAAGAAALVAKATGASDEHDDDDDDEGDEEDDEEGDEDDDEDDE